MIERTLYALTDEEAAAIRITLAYMRRTQIDAEHEAKFSAAYEAMCLPASRAHASNTDEPVFWKPYPEEEALL